MKLSQTDVEKVMVIAQAGWCNCKVPSRIGESKICNLCIKVIKEPANNEDV